MKDSHIHSRQAGAAYSIFHGVDADELRRALKEAKALSKRPEFTRNLANLVQEKGSRLSWPRGYGAP